MRTLSRRHGSLSVVGTHKLYSRGIIILNSHSEKGVEVLIANVQVEERKIPGWMRGLEVALGVLSMVLAFIVLGYPSIAVLTLLVYLSVSVVFVGIRQIMIGAGVRWLPGWIRALYVVVGVLALLLGALVIAFPGFGVATLILLLAFGLFLFGITEIAVGATARFMRGWLRGLLIVIGILDLILAPIALLMPALAVATLILLLALFLVFTGVDLVVSAVAGRVGVVRASAGPAPGKGPA